MLTLLCCPRPLLVLVFSIFIQVSLFAQGTPGLDARAYEARRQAVMHALPDGLIMLQARTDVKRFTETGLHQDLDFYYLTGLEHMLGAILVLDGSADSTWLFLPTHMTGLAARLTTQIPPGPGSESRTRIDRVVDRGLSMPT